MVKKAMLLVAMLAIAAMVSAGDAPKAWFDMEGCEFCKHMMTDPKLMDNMTWECHDITNGAVMITTVKPESRKSYDMAMKGMMELGNKMKSGEVDPMKVKMCGHCMAYGQLMEKGMKTDYVMGTNADVTILTSDKPEMVAEIKTFAQKNRDEMKKWEAEHADAEQN
jgi:hypothetical protein